MAKACSYGFGTDVSSNFEKTLEDVESLLADKGFTIHTRLDVEEILSGVKHEQFGRYVILGACNPQFAKDLFNSDVNIGLLMPCNIVVYERRDGGCRGMIKDPARIMDMIDNPYTIQAAIEVKEKLEQVIEALDVS